MFIWGREQRVVAGSARAACPAFGARNTRRDSVTAHSQLRRTQSLRVLRDPNAGHAARAGYEHRVLLLVSFRCFII